MENTKEVPINEVADNCTFCNSDDLELIDDPSGLFYIYCNSCQAEGPAAINRYHAVVLWNYRH